MAVVNAAEKPIENAIEILPRCVRGRTIRGDGDTRVIPVGDFWLILGSSAAPKILF